MENPDLYNPEQRKEEGMPLQQLIDEIEKKISNDHEKEQRPIFEKFLTAARKYDGPVKDDWRDVWMDVINWAKEKGLLEIHEYGYLFMLMK
jgi:Tat protein secretion system quality control protein TatD with DNase activity